MSRAGVFRPGTKKAQRNRTALCCATSVASILLATASLITSAGVAPAQEAGSEVRSFNIPSLPLPAAVAAFGRQSGLQVSLAASSGQGIRTHAVTGTMEPFAALSRMLSGTGLYWWLSDDGAVIITTSGAPSGNADTANGELLDTILVNDEAGTGYQGTPDWVYETPDSVSVLSSDAIENMAVRDTNQLFNSVSGAYAGSTPGSFPTVSPNIRGLQDQGRVVVSIEGARQNAQDGGRYSGASQGGMSMAFVDTAFVREIDITKKTSAAVNNAGSLGGTVDFRLVKADDIIAPGNTWGIETEGGTGTNGFEFDGSFVGAMRFGEVVSVTLGASRSVMNGYEPGENGDAEGRFDLTYRRGWSALGKLEAEFDTVTASLAWLHQQNNFAYDVLEGKNGSSFDAGTNTVVADLDWVPDSPLIDFSGKLWGQTSHIGETRDARIVSGTVNAAETFIDKSFTSFGVTLDNTSQLTSRLGDISLNYGIEAFRDVSGKRALSSSIDSNPLYASSYGSWTPPGRRDVASAFMNGTLEPTDWVKLSGGLRYDWYRLKGHPTYYGSTLTTVRYVAQPVISRYDFLVANDPANVPTNPIFINIFKNDMGENIDGSFVPAGQSIDTNTTTIESETPDIERSDGAWLPSATIEFSPFDWLSPYASYSQSFRPPTITEAFASGAVSPQDRIGTTLAPNEDLRPEKARTFEVGANLVTGDLVTDGDRLRFKVSGFYREVDDYIVVGEIVTGVSSDTTFNSFVNLDGMAYMTGLELEGNYDTGVFWLGGSFTFLDVAWPQKTQRFSNATQSTTGETIYWNSAIPPRQKFVLDAGVRLFDRRLSLGARVNHAEPSGEPQLDSEGNVIEISEAYTTLDLYGSLKVTDNAVLHMSVNNATDVNYVPVNSTYLAPGRTFQASLKIRF